MWDASSIDLYCLPSLFECILAVVPHPLVSISETAGGHEGRWECQPHMPRDPAQYICTLSRAAVSRHETTKFAGPTERHRRCPEKVRGPS